MRGWETQKGSTMFALTLYNSNTRYVALWSGYGMFHHPIDNAGTVTTMYVQWLATPPYSVNI